MLFDIRSTLLETDTDVGYIARDTSRIYSALGYSYGTDGFRLRDDFQAALKHIRNIVTNTTTTVINTSTLVEKTTKLVENSDSVLTKLDEIIAALEALAESGGSSGGGSGSGVEISQDWLKETTFTTARAEDNAATQEYRDWWKTAWGFNTSSVPYSLKQFLFGNSKSPSSAFTSFHTINSWNGGASPFPEALEGQWQQPYTGFFTVTDPTNVRALPQYLSYVLAWNLTVYKALDTAERKKQAWNDYYAHTNLVANLWAIHNTAPTGESPTIGFADGVLTYKDGSSASGSSAPTTQTLDLNPVATNAYDSVVGDITTLTESVSSGTSTGDNPIDTDAIRARYFAYLDIQGASTDIGDDIRAASSSGETLKINFMGCSAELDLAAWGTSYRSIMTQERLRTWRGAMGIIWMLAAWCGGFYLVKRLGNME